MAKHSLIDVRFNELDPYGHVNHAVYATYCEVGRTDALISCGADLATVAEAGYQIVLTELNIKFLKPAMANDRLVVQTWLHELGALTGMWHQRIIRTQPGNEPEVLIKVEASTCITDRNGRPTRPPEDLKAALATLAGPPEDLQE